MREAVIVSYARTGLAKSGRGGFNITPPMSMAAHAIKHAVERAGVDKEYVEDCYLGNCAHGAPNIGRQAALLAGMPKSTAGVSVNRFCSSGLQTIAMAANSIRSDGADCIVAGGVESISIPGGGSPKESIDPDLLKAAPDIFMAMIDTADIVAERYKLSREYQDEYSLESQRRMAAAQQANKFKDEIVPMKTKMKVVDKATKAESIVDYVVDKDECNRPETTLEGLAKLEPVKGPGKFVTAGNASQLSDGAAAVVLMEAKDAEKRGLNPLGRFVAWAAAGCEPDEMGIGPIYAVPKLLKRHGLKIDDIDLWELNEAFASQCLYSRDKLGIDPEKYNVNGGSIAIGHPVRHDRRASAPATSCRKAAGARPSGASSRCASAAARAARACSRSTAEIFALARNSDRNKENGSARSHFPFEVSASVAMLLDDHDLVAMTMPPSAMVAAVAMPAIFGTRAIAMMMAVVAATLDHDSLGARNRRRRDDDRTKCGDNVSKLLHSSPPQLIEDRTSHRSERSRGTSKRILNACSDTHGCTRRPFDFWLVS